MRASCLINNHNYRQYLLDAIDSALGQTVPFDELVLVDDGSTDGSPNAVRARYGSESRLRVIVKENEGQLSCFNVGWAACTGDIIFFLDADDTYAANYVEEALAVYRKYAHVDFVFCEYREFGDAATAGKGGELPDRDLGCSLIPTLFTGQWIGAPTSCLSMRRTLLAKILPIPWLEDWRIRADDCLVLGASLVCGSKYRLGKRLVNYRLHGQNAFAGVARHPLIEYKHRVAVNRLIKMFTDRMSYDVDALANSAHHEFRTMSEFVPWKRLERYAKVVRRSKLRWSRKVSLLTAMSTHLAASWLVPGWSRGRWGPTSSQGTEAGEASRPRHAA